MTRHTAPRRCGLIVITCTVLLNSASPEAQAAESSALKRNFLDRYLDCVEAPGAQARLECFDQLLIDIPAWLDEPSDPLYVSYQPSPQDTRAKTLAKKPH